MTATVSAAPATAEDPGLFREGWRKGVAAARFAVYAAQGDAKPAGREALGAALARIDAIKAPSGDIARPRADRLAAAIGAALALADADLGPEAVAVLRDAIA